MTPKKIAKRYARDNGLEGWNEMAIWREFKPPSSQEIYGWHILST
jgi:hypothetical protein